MAHRAACHAASLEASCRTESRWMTAAVRAEGARLPSKPSWNGTQLLFGGLQVASPARRSTALPPGIHGCLSPPMRCAALITRSLELRHPEAQKMRRQVLSNRRDRIRYRNKGSNCRLSTCAWALALRSREAEVSRSVGGCTISSSPSNADHDATHPCAANWCIFGSATVAIAVLGLPPHYLYISHPHTEKVVPRMFSYADLRVHELDVQPHQNLQSRNTQYLVVCRATKPERGVVEFAEAERAPIHRQVHCKPEETDGGRCGGYRQVRRQQDHRVVRPPPNQS